MKRTLILESLQGVGKTVLLQGWVNARRDHGQVIFIDLRDRSGIVQVVGGKELSSLRDEDVVEIEGLVKKRPEKLINPNLSTGKIEIEARKVKVLSKSLELPLPVSGDGRDIEEVVRLKYRYLDLRRPRLNKNIRLRSKFVDLCRQYLFSNDFVEIETPLLTKSTPEGSRDFVVPSRLQPGKFYALPQSPQQYKQLLMVAGFERYFQIARCLRDEDLRADRGFEHTQIDMEMSFVKREDIMKITEEMFISVFEKLGGKILKKPFPVFSYEKALKKFGADKFDLRNESQKKENILSFAWVVDFPFFEKDKEGKWTYTHNPFSNPVEEDKEKFLKGKIEGIRTSQYDLICNGYEVGGGSIRSTNPKILSKVFSVLGYEDKEIQEKFGHILEAFKYGVPPHGGIAPGIDRLLMVLTGETALKEVVAFPTTASGQTSVMSAPAKLSQEQLKELGIKVIK
ncbi:aspartate--tRNA ligase [Candidatus Beckwithbacteria bacterium CG10_big_fil_rev_8_21_14_0_10_34_10]|uniref:Aspartate--tRNA(Asp/Asn) ligase n=1 Tax=Candidatus Beckwithbacteria bacterium CG10_big_fil_rev_8_21_14_0_10_34_10 TaxID=1974495 RepID=A0A2H0W8J0_9BACT|nr:MAG: aspartate--tRNA ligase [Candidatus Beckwithbacteria bacterium CG10_big_fil_rev_8_21_14_0_10_34_10]